MTAGASIRRVCARPALAALLLAACSGAGRPSAVAGEPGALERALGLEPRPAATPLELTERTAAELLAPPEAAPIAEEPAKPDWPATPALGVQLVDREGTAHALDCPPPSAWIEEGRRRWSEERHSIAGTALLLWREQWRQCDATRVTLALVNAFPDRGVAYFQELVVELDGQRAWHLEGRHCIVPRGILAKRLFHGPDAAQLVSWSVLRGSLPTWTPAWAARRCAEELARLKRSLDGDNQLGPYRIGDPIVRESSSLGGSHGGWKVAPYGGGSRSWYAGVIEGWQLAEEQFLRTLSRSPIAILDAQTLQPYNPGVEYWLGRTIPHELPGFRAVPDDWCPYGERLHRFRPHSCSHMWRQIRDAAMLAPHDAAARWFLLTSWHDCLLWLESGGATSANPLFWPLERLVATTPPGRGAWWASRNFAHVVRCFVEVEPYLAPEDALHWRARLVAALRHVIVPGTGVAHGSDRPDDLDPTVEPPTARAREVDLLGCSFLPLGMHQEDADWRRFMAPLGGVSVSGMFQIRPGMKSWADGRGAAPAYFPEYDAFRGDLHAYGGTLEGLMQHASTRPVNENPLDWTDPSVWHPTRTRGR